MVSGTCNTRFSVRADLRNLLCFYKQFFLGECWSQANIKLQTGFFFLILKNILSMTMKQIYFRKRYLLKLWVEYIFKNTLNAIFYYLKMRICSVQLWFFLSGLLLCLYCSSRDLVRGQSSINGAEEDSKKWNWCGPELRSKKTKSWWPG